jgi:uncharacterized protein YggE
MKRVLLLLALAAAPASVCRAQASGNVAYSQQQGRQSDRAVQQELAKRGQVDASGDSLIVDASVLMNVRADEHVAVFGVMQECAAVPECTQKVDAMVAEFTAGLRQLGVAPGDVFVDFAAQNKIYGYELEKERQLAREKLAGFELKKNVSVRYRERLLLDRIVVAAARAGIFDLIKVDYFVRDTAAVNNRLAEEAARIVKEKAARHERLLGVKFRRPPQVYTEKPSVYFPVEMYDSYAAAESENITQPYYDRQQQYTIQSARKSRTFYFNALTADNFDLVIEPVVLEPVVQFTYYLKVKYDLEPNPAAKVTTKRRRGRRG